MASRADNFRVLTATLAAFVWVQVTTTLLAQSQADFEEHSGLGELASSSLSSSNAGVSANGVPPNADAVLEEMSLAAGVIFVGEVTAVRLPVELGGSGASEGIVEVDFRVDEALRGAVPRPVYTLREWAGLWSAYSEGARYRVGQRLLMFLYQPDLHGLSSPVHGCDGAVPVRGGSVAPGADDTKSSAGGWMVDLRWLQARALKSSVLVMLPVLRPIVLRPVHGFLPEEGEIQGRIESKSDSVRREPAAAPVATTASIETQSLAQVIALCRKAMRRSDAGQ